MAQKRAESYHILQKDASRSPNAVVPTSNAGMLPHWLSKTGSAGAHFDGCTRLQQTLSHNVPQTVHRFILGRRQGKPVRRASFPTGGGLSAAVRATYELVASEVETRSTPVTSPLEVGASDGNPIRTTTPSRRTTAVNAATAPPTRTPVRSKMAVRAPGMHTNAAISASTAASRSCGISMRLLAYSSAAASRHSAVPIGDGDGRATAWADMSALVTGTRVTVSALPHTGSRQVPMRMADKCNSSKPVCASAPMVCDRCERLPLTGRRKRSEACHA